MGSVPTVAAVPRADGAALRRLERAENFPVALRVLPRAVRDDLRAVYDVARFVDDVGDDPAAAPEDRSRRLDLVGADVRVAFTGGEPQLDVVRRLVPVIRRRGLEPDPFLDLVEANKRDQVTSRYPTYDHLRNYCRSSADPVGRIVLAVFDARDPRTQQLSDRVCTALQILEHCQDVREDLRDRDRIYLPLDDLARFGVSETDLDAPVATQAVRRLLAFEVDRAARLLDEGAPIAALLHGWARVAVAGYVAGGRATVDAIRRADHDVLASTPRPRRRDIARHALRLVRGRT